MLVAMGAWIERRKAAETAADGQELEETTLVRHTLEPPGEAGPEKEVSGVP